MKNRLIEEMDHSGRNWREELKREIPPAVIEELTQEHVEQIKGIEATEEFLNQVEKLLDCPLHEAQTILYHKKEMDPAPPIPTPQKSHQGNHGDLSSRSNLHHNPQSGYQEGRAPDVGSEAIVSGREPLHPSIPGEAVLEDQLPMYSKELSLFKKGPLGRILHKLGFIKKRKPKIYEEKVKNLSVNEWRELIKEADRHLHFYEFDLERHLKKEDDVLFPVIAKLGVTWSEISRDLEDQHAQQRDFIKACRDYWNQANRADSTEIQFHALTFFRVLDTYLQHLIGHLDYEDNYVFEPAQGALSQNAKENLEKIWKKFKTEFQEPKVPEDNILND